MADGLSYADQFKPMLTLTMATLTGAAAVAIGGEGVVAMGNAPEKYRQQLMVAGNKVYERVAEFPFWDEYNEMIKSDIADVKNIGGRVAGAITAGKFLEHFTGSPFIHIDIAGPAYSKTRHNYQGKGASGVGVRLLYSFIKNLTV